jgi:acyl carrier protein
MALSTEEVLAGLAELINAEEKFDVKIPDEEVKNLKTVGDAVDFIVKAQA